MDSYIFRNKLNQELSLLVGEGHIVEPYGEVVLDEHEALVARGHYKDVLEEVTLEGVGQAIHLDKDAPIWLANMAGDPDAPEYIESRMVRNKLTNQVEPQRVPNMLRKPLDYSVMWREKTYIRRVGNATKEFKPPKKKQTVRCWQRRPVPAPLARAILGRVGNASPGSRGHVIESRPPSNFEPDGSWSLDEIRNWLKMVDHRCELGSPEEDLRKAASNRAEADREIRRAKVVAMKRVHLRAADPQYKLPTKREFEQFLGRDEVEKAAAKRPVGRPKKTED